jgi:hypothetical protein
VASSGPLGTVIARDERTDMSGVNDEGVRVPTERLRLRSSVASSGPLGTVTEREERTERKLSGVPIERAEGVRAPTE